MFTSIMMSMSGRPPHACGARSRVLRERVHVRDLHLDRLVALLHVGQRSRSSVATRAAEQPLTYVKQGYKAIKMQVAHVHTLAQDLENVRRMREAVGPDIDIMMT